MKTDLRSVAICFCCIALTACKTAHTADFLATPAERLVWLILIFVGMLFAASVLSEWIAEWLAGID